MKQITSTLMSRNYMTLDFDCGGKEFVLDVDFMGTYDDWELWADCEGETPKHVYLLTWNQSRGYAGLTMFTLDDNHENYETCEEHNIFLQNSQDVEGAGIDLDYMHETITNLLNYVEVFF